MKARTKPALKGTVFGDINPDIAPFPAPGKVTRYILTSIQNNTHVHQGLWENIRALADYYGAQIFVATFSYDRGAYGKKAVKFGTHSSEDEEDAVWFDKQVEPFIKDANIQLGKGLVWCGKTNIMPTASNPLSGFETFAGRNSAIFPHTKLSMRSIASLQGSGAKLIYTTGTVGLRGYIQKTVGFKAEFHHCYGALLVEVDSEGVWKVRQLDAEDTPGTFYDLTLKVENGKVTEGHRVEAITWGDIHAACIDKDVLRMSTEGKDCMLDVLRPKYQFLHDLIEGASVNHHDANKPLERFKTELRGLSVIQNELTITAQVISKYHRNKTMMVVVNSNHDRWLDRWLDSYNHQLGDARNAEIFHDASAARIRSAREGNHLVVLEYLIRKHGGFRIPAKFLQMDESFLLCAKRIECGQHGDLGPNGSRGSALSLSKVGRRSNICHTHTAGIYDGLYVAGTSTDFRMGYNHGPSSWTHSHIVTYPNGKRTIITMFNGAWRAE